LNVRVVTAGSPSVGDQKFVQSYNKLGIETTRYENGRDLVTRVAQLAGWNHVGNSVNLQSPIKNLTSKAMGLTPVTAVVDAVKQGMNHLLSGYKSNGGINDDSSLSDEEFQVMFDILSEIFSHDE